MGQDSNLIERNDTLTMRFETCPYILEQDKIKWNETKHEQDKTSKTPKGTRLEQSDITKN